MVKTVKPRADRKDIRLGMNMAKVKCLVTFEQSIMRVVAHDAVFISQHRCSGIPAV